MRFINSPREVLEAALAAEIRQALGKGSVAWIVPGGSNAGSVGAVLQRLDGNDNSKLTIILSDEIYGQPGHQTSNEQKIKDAGMDLHGANYIPVLTGEDLDTVTARYNQSAAKLLAEADTVIAFLGVGASGLVAGISPGTPSVYALKDHVIGYQVSGMVRLTMTPFAFSHVDLAIIGAYGSEKGSILRSLAEENVMPQEQPCQLLKHIPKVFIYNDQMEAEV